MEEPEALLRQLQEAEAWAQMQEEPEALLHESMHPLHFHEGKEKLEVEKHLQLLHHLQLWLVSQSFFIVLVTYFLFLHPTEPQALRLKFQREALHPLHFHVEQVVIDLEKHLHRGNVFSLALLQRLRLVLVTNFVLPVPRRTLIY